MSRTGHRGRHQMALGAGDTVGDISALQMARMGSHRQLAGGRFPMQSTGRRAGLVVNPAVAKDTGGRVGAMAGGTAGSVADLEIDLTVDMKRAADDGQQCIHDTGMAVGTGQPGRADMKGVLPLQFRGSNADVMAGTAVGLAGSGPDRGVGSIAAVEITVAIGSGAGPGRSIPGRAAAIGDPLPSNFGDRIDRLMSDPARTVDMPRIGDKDGNIVAGTTGDSDADGILGTA